MIAGPALPVAGERIEHHFLTMYPLGDHPGTGAGIMVIEPGLPEVALHLVGQRCLGADDPCAPQGGERVQEAGECMAEMENYGRRVGRIDGANLQEVAHGALVELEEAVEAELNGSSVHRVAVVELHAGTELEGPGLAIFRAAPGGCQVGHNLYRLGADGAQEAV